MDWDYLTDLTGGKPNFNMFTNTDILSRHRRYIQVVRVLQVDSPSAPCYRLGTKEKV